MSKLKFFLITLIGSVAFGVPMETRSNSRAISNDAISHSPVEVAQFAFGTWVENIAVRSDGKILVTMTTPPEIWEIDPLKSSELNSTKLIHHFDSVEQATGIAEVGADVFMVVGGNSIWRVDMNKNDTNRISKVVSVTNSHLLNGMATLDAGIGTILVADSELGLIWRVNTKTLDYEVALQDDTMAPNDELGLSLGVNGVQVSRNYVYYNNNNPRRLLCRVHVDRATGRAAGPYEVISQGVLSDDFAVASDGTAYLSGLTDKLLHGFD